MIVPNQQNLKVHFATVEQSSRAVATKAAGVDYALGTAFPFVYKMFKNGKYDDRKLIKNMSSKYKHYILDSGLFTLMFGSLKGKKDEAYLDKWYECLTDYVLQEDYKGTMVEVDCQKVLGVDKAWEYRRKMREKVSNRIINVFHFEDGQKGLDKLVEYSDYIALSVPELRFIKKKEYLYRLASYIKNKKPDIDIHLLGFTEKTNLQKMQFCSSCDSSSWTSPLRYGYMQTLHGDGHIKTINKKVIEQFGNKYVETRNELFPYVNLPKDLKLDALFTLSAHKSLEIYNKFAGNQN